jgi:hypothetical protein
MSGTTNDAVRLRMLEILYKKATEGTNWAVEREEMKQLLPVPENQLDFNMLYLREKSSQTFTYRMEAVGRLQR